LPEPPVPPNTLDGDFATQSRHPTFDASEAAGETPTPDPSCEHAMRFSLAAHPDLDVVVCSEPLAQRQAC
jgi:hypothetical protein